MERGAVNPGMAQQVTLRLWFHVVCHRRFRVLFSHPHHYATAVGLCAFLAITGHLDRAIALGSFGYALFENLCTVAEEEIPVILEDL